MFFYSKLKSLLWNFLFDLPLFLRFSHKCLTNLSSLHPRQLLCVGQPLTVAQPFWVFFLVERFLLLLLLAIWVVGWGGGVFSFFFLFLWVCWFCLVFFSCVGDFFYDFDWLITHQCEIFVSWFAVLSKFDPLAILLCSSDPPSSLTPPCELQTMF